VSRRISGTGRQILPPWPSQGPGARIDAKKAISVSAKMAYPWVFPFREGTSVADVE
jgi:hypothetical protein